MKLTSIERLQRNHNAGYLLETTYVDTCCNSLVFVQTKPDWEYERYYHSNLWKHVEVPFTQKAKGLLKKWARCGTSITPICDEIWNRYEDKRDEFGNLSLSDLDSLVHEEFSATGIWGVPSPFAHEGKSNSLRELRGNSYVPVDLTKLDAQHEYDVYNELLAMN